jgi:hypothetical protein
LLVWEPWSIAFDNVYSKPITVQDSYNSLQDWFVAEVQDLSDWTAFVAQNFAEYKFETDGYFLGTTK